MAPVQPTSCESRGSTSLHPRGSRTSEGVGLRALKKTQSYVPSKVPAPKGLEKAKSYVPQKTSDVTRVAKKPEVSEPKELTETQRRWQLLASNRDIRVVKRKPKKVCFGSATSTGRTELVKKDAPGPGEYDLKASQGKCASNFSLQKPRDAPDWLKSAKPDLGPGMYDIKPLLGAGPKYKMSAKRQEPRPNGVPGPGHYNGLEHTIAAALEREAAMYE
uniref:Uncharacterized protein n=1 Tax=Noctiluca scintillans TaxID=2966 RepID=A0A7S1B075_NOCSC